MAGRWLQPRPAFWLKTKCLNREEFVVVGWTDPEGARPFLGALLLGYYDPDGKLTYAGRGGTGINQAELERLSRRLQLLATPKMPLDVPPPRSTFGSPLLLSLVVGTALRSATYSEDILSGIGAPQPSVSPRKADRQFRVTVSWAQLRN